MTLDQPIMIWSQVTLDHAQRRQQTIQPYCHLILIELLFMSFESFPLGESISLEPLVQPVIDWSSSIFTGGLLIALPIMIAMLLVNTGLGIITRSAPSLNIIAVGFPAITLIGVFILLLSLGTLAYQLHPRKVLPSSKFRHPHAKPNGKCVRE